MTHLQAHEGVTQAAVSVDVIATATGRRSARLHLSIHPGEIILALVEGQPVRRFRWRDGPICGVHSTAGWVEATRDDERPTCQTCQVRWETLADLYHWYAEPQRDRRPLR